MLHNAQYALIKIVIIAAKNIVSASTSTICYNGLQWTSTYVLWSILIYIHIFSCDSKHFSLLSHNSQLKQSFWLLFLSTINLLGMHERVIYDNNRNIKINKTFFCFFLSRCCSMLLDVNRLFWYWYVSEDENILRFSSHFIVIVSLDQWYLLELYHWMSCFMLFWLGSKQNWLFLTFQRGSTQHSWFGSTYLSWMRFKIKLEFNSSDWCFILND